MPTDRAGLLLVPLLMSFGVVSVLLVGYFSIPQHQANMVRRAAARAQALYLAEAGLDAANDLLSQDWRTYQDVTLFPIREEVSIALDGHPMTIGEFEVTVHEVDPGTLRLVSTGRSLPTSNASGTGPPTYPIERTFSMVIARKDKPRFERVGPPGVLELEAHYFNKDGLPDLLALSGNMVSAHGKGKQAGIRRSSDRNARKGGRYLFAGFTDVDLDGDLDLVLSQAPSRGDGHQQAVRSPYRPQTMTAADVLGNGSGIPVAAHGWLWLPEGTLSGLEPDTELFLNHPVYDGTLMVSWTEQ